MQCLNLAVYATFLFQASCAKLVYVFESSELTVQGMEPIFTRAELKGLLLLDKMVNWSFQIFNLPLLQLADLDQSIAYDLGLSR